MNTVIEISSTSFLYLYMLQRSCWQLNFKWMKNGFLQMRNKREKGCKLQTQENVLHTQRVSSMAAYDSL